MRSIKLLMLLLSMLAGPAFAWESLTRNVDLRCEQPEQRTLHCDYRMLESETPPQVSASVGQTSLKVSPITRYPWDGARTAVLFVVDTSDPGREDVIRKNIAQIEQIMGAAHAYDTFGLASFDSDLKMLAPVGSRAEQVIAAARQLKATGMTTELYRSLIKAVDVLSQVQADRRAIFVFSDGQAEDEAYFLQDVSKEARKYGVVINSLGFPRSVRLSVALQTMRRLSQESGGIFLESGSSYDLPPGYTSTVFSNIDRGGKFDVDLGALMSGVPSIQVRFQSSENFELSVPVSLPAQRAGPAPVRTESQPATQPEVRVITEEQPKSEIDAALSWGTPLALLVLIVLALVTLVVVYRTTGTTSKPAARSSSTPEYKPYAYLIAQDETKKRYPVTRTIWRIGRSSDNEMTLEDNSVSRRHAEIQRTPEGVFVVIDRNSMNGIFVNGEKVGRRELQEGDIIEIGDIHLRFTESPADDNLADITSMQRTRTPSVP